QTYQCEAVVGANGDIIPGDSPVQLVTAVGESTQIDPLGFQTTVVSSSVHDGFSLFGRDVGGVADYFLQCGYTEFQTPVLAAVDSVSYNDCPLEGGDAANEFGVSSNSCCYPRMKRVEAYPEDGAGLSSALVCRNTFISFSFNGYLDENSLQGNVVVAKGHERENFNCALDGQNAVAVTDLVSDTFAFADQLFDRVTPDDGLIPWLWWHVKQLFARVFVSDVRASQFALNNIHTWCAGMVSVTPDIQYTFGTDNNAVTSTVSLYIDSLLDENAMYAVVLSGGQGGIVDQRGVGIKNANNDVSLDDSFVFQTGSDICKIQSISVTPSTYTYSAPNTTATFTAHVESTNGQQIASIPGQYAWQWSWGPQQHPVFVIPADGAQVDGPTTTIGVTTLEGEIDALAIAQVTADIDPNPTTSHIGRSFAGPTHLQATFCERPWPLRDADQQAFDDEQYNFSFHYCADSGLGGVTEDDLPFFDIFTFTENNREQDVTRRWCSERGENDHFVCVTDADCAGETNVCEDVVERVSISEGVLPQSTLKRYLMFNEQNEDAIGVQIFKNPDRLDPREWYASQEVSGGQFSNISQFRDTQIANYPAITDGTNYYVHALNKIDHPIAACGNTTVCSNMYHFSINDTAQDGSRNVFQQIIDTLAFNTNLTDYQYCGASDSDLPDYLYVNTPCTNDFECAPIVKDIQTNPAQSGRCSLATETVSPVNIAGFVEDVDFVDENNGWAVGNAGVILSTSDQGIGWEEQNSSVSVDLYGVDFITESRGIAVGAEGTVVKTEDGGATWTRVADTGTLDRLTSVDFVSGQVGYAAGDDGSFLRTTDGGNSWTHESLQYNEQQLSTITNILFIGENRGMVITDNGQLLLTMDGGVTWEAKIQEQGVFHDIFFIDNSIGWAIGSDVGLWRTLDGGNTWNSLDYTFDDNSTVRGSQALAISFTSARDGLFAGANGSLYRTANGGLTWVFVEQINHPLRALYFLPQNVGFAAGGNFDITSVFVGGNICVANNECVGSSICEGVVFADVEQYVAPDCKADRTEFLHDWRVQLPALGSIQQALERYVAQTNVYPSLESGTFIPNYTNSRWPSWNQTFAQTLGAGIPRDSVNDWTSCGYCEGAETQFCTENSDCPVLDGQAGTCRTLDSQTCWDPDVFTYVCPAYSNVFEYVYHRESGNYTLHSSLAYFDLSDPVVQEFIDPSTIELTPYCQPNEIFSPFSERCGDGVVNSTLGENGQPKEQCDPPGSVRVSNVGFASVEVGSCNYAFNNSTQCGVDADCPAVLVQVGDQQYMSEGAKSDTYCAWQNSLIYGDIRDGQLETWSCTQDSDCRSAGLYGLGTTLDSANGQLVDYLVEANSVNNNDFRCVRHGLHDDYVDIAPRGSISCIAGVAGEFTQCAPGSLATATCTDSCTFEYGSCISQFACGNGVVEGTELCDDGAALNGTFGHCNENCSGRFAAFCGNGQRDWADSNNNDYRDPDEVGQEFCEIDDFTSTGFCSSNRSEVCTNNSDCGYCVSDPELSCGECPQDPITCDELPGTCRITYQTDAYGSCGQDDDCRGQKVISNTQVTFGWMDDLLERDKLFFSDQQSVCVTNHTGADEMLVQRTPNNGAYPGASVIYGFGCTQNSECQQVDTYASRGDAGANTRLGLLRIDLSVQDSTATSYGVSDATFVDAVLPNTSCKALTNVGWLYDGNGFSIGSNSCQASRVSVCSNNTDQQCQSADDCSLCDQGLCLANTTSQYHIERELSCSWDCQSVGGYCGDGITQFEFEECDGGDGCSAVCTLTESAQQEQGQQGVDPDRPRCGDGVWQQDYDGDGRTDEVCDQGGLNGISCTPQYGQSCSYCSYDCQAVLAVDPVSFCGDGQLDEANEQCETIGQSRIVVPGQNPGSVEDVICEDLGNYQCNNTCSALTNNCVSCVVLDEPQGAEPRLAMLNPMITISTEGTFPEDSWVALTNVQLFRPDAAVPQFRWGMRYRGLPGFNEDVHGLNYEESFTLTNFQDAHKTIESNVQCNGQYYYAFNTDGHCDGDLLQLCDADLDCNNNGPCRFGSDYALSSQERSEDWYRPYPVSVNDGEQSPYYTYVVDSEPTNIVNEVVVSPAVPEGVYRFVLRWGNTVAETNARLGLAVYNLGFPDSQKQIGYHTFAPVADFAPWAHDIKLMNDVDSNDYRFNYWWPTQVDTTLQQRSVFLHDVQSLDKTFIQAMTIDTNDHWGSGVCQNNNNSCRTNSDCGDISNDPTGICDFDNSVQPLRTFAVYVTSLNGPITQYDDMEIYVDVYAYKEGQDPTFSLLKPIATYNIQSATKSTNARARYWHVANVVKIDTTEDGSGDSYILESPIEAFPDVSDSNNNGSTEDFILTSHPQGSIETGFQDIRCNTPEEREICQR
ncbi:MAG: hypothetical protein GW939_03780, partial [Candidatus Magasanikbacteria bacterium]|nr:hypothetical protein [Candidatus Magasanikbacteria bacterium]